MDNFKIIYRILKELEAAMDYQEVDVDAFSAEVLGITQERWSSIMAMLIDNGYVSGAQSRRHMRGPVMIVNRGKAEITLKGLEYLSENSLMQKAANLAKGIKETIPFV